jgi:hypothetical protein
MHQISRRARFELIIRDNPPGSSHICPAQDAVALHWNSAVICSS